MKTHPLQALLAKPGAGIYSVCSAHRWVIRAAAEQAVADDSLLLVEATSNQVNQFGGYTGMRPADFRRFAAEIAGEAGLPVDRLILGGDHLGPNPWHHLPAAEAMVHAETMVAEYAAAGFTKIHLDASMGCAGEGHVIPDELVAKRAAQLAAVAERSRTSDEPLVYVIGTEVPTPGGATHALDGLQVTSVAAAQRTWDVHRETFAASEAAAAWPNVLALVVQPGVEFGHDSVVEYDRAKASTLSRWLRDGHGPQTFEAHSTDYQLPQAYPALVQDGFGILKVGPALTFAMREALYALEAIEQVLIDEPRRSHLAATLEQRMLEEPKDWSSHYPGSAAEQKLLRHYSYSDRIRYYWTRPEVAASVDTLLRNLKAAPIAETLLSQYLPVQYARVREGMLPSEPLALVLDQVRDVLRVYATACRPSSIS